MAASDSGHWVFTKEQLQNTPSRKCNIDYDKELYYRQQAATLIQEMGQKLQVTQLCINTAIVYVHRFYMFHSFTKFHRNPIASCAIFLAAKVEEQPRKLEHVIRVAHMILYKTQSLDTNSEQYIEQAQELINNENILLQTLGFDVAIDHPHTQVLKCCQHLFRASSRDMAQTSYFMATNSLHLTTMCLQYKPTVVACVCIHLVCKWFNYEIPQSSEGKDWYWYVDKSVTIEQLDELTVEFLAIFNKCPSRLRKRVMQQPGVNAAGITDKDSTHQDAHSSLGHKSRTDPSSSGSAKPGERVPRPHDQRRDKLPVPGPPGSSSSSSGSTGQRPSISGHPHSHSSRPPEGSGGASHHHHHHHSTSSRPHPDKPVHPHQRPSNSIKDTKPPSNSTSHPFPSLSQQQQQQQPRIQQQQLSQQQPHSQHSSSQQRKSTTMMNAAKAPSSGSLFSPPQNETTERKLVENKKPSAAPVTSQEWTGNGSLSNSSSQPQQQQQQQMSLSTSLGFSLDLDEICVDQDSTWDINYDLEPSSLSPTAAIESMLSSSNQHNAAADASLGPAFQVKQQPALPPQQQPPPPPPVQQQQQQPPPQQPPPQQQPHQQSLFDLLAPSPKFHQPAQPIVNPSLPLTPQPHVPPVQVQQQQQQPPPFQQLSANSRSLFDLGFENENDTFTTTVKTEETTACVEIKSELVDVAEETVDHSGKGDKKKKKKKEKHKNKDKDREKDKKHKHKHKDKDKHKEKEKHKESSSSRSSVPELKISNLVPASSTSPEDAAGLKAILKLKIPKGRIEGDAASAVNGSSSPPPPPLPAAAQPVLAAGGLKIKISRDMISNSKDKDSRKRTNSSTNLNNSGSTSSSASARGGAGVPAAKQAKMESPQLPTLPPGAVATAHNSMGQQQQRAHHERNGSSGHSHSEEREGRHQQQQQQQHRSSGAHPQRSSGGGLNKVSNTLPAYPHPPPQPHPVPHPHHPPSYPPRGGYPLPYHPAAYPPPIPNPHPNFYPYPPSYNPYGMYPYQAPHMPPMMNSNLPPPMPAGGVGMPPLPRDPPPQPPPPPPQT